MSLDLQFGLVMRLEVLNAILRLFLQADSILGIDLDLPLSMDRYSLSHRNL